MAKRKKKTSKHFIIPAICLAIATTSIYFIMQYFSRPNFITYPAFGISIPANHSIHGIDVSKYQNNINWKAVKAMQVEKVKIGFAFIKATEGLGRVDAKYRKNWYYAQEENLAKGAYHFFICSKSGKAQAENFIETVQLEKGDLPPVLDIETTNGASKEEIQKRAKDWLDKIEKHYQVKSIIYTNVYFYENYLKDSFADYPLWVAHYLVKNKPRIERKWQFWQHNEKGRVDGINAFVDFNVFNGDSSDFKKLLIK